jgi:small subunit ribosomal protein S20
VPNTESAKKRVRQTADRRARNNWRKRRIKEQLATLHKALHDRDSAAADAELRKTAQLLDKIAATGTIHKNTAARRKSRLTARVRAMKQA